MIRLSTRVEDLAVRLLLGKAASATFRNLGHAAASIRKTAVASIVRRKGPSSAGKPPHTRRGHLRRAIRFDVTKSKQSAVIGPMASVVGESASAHEFGRVYKGTKFPERPFMGPSMISNLDRMAADWAGSIRS